MADRPAEVYVTKERRGALASSSLHWTRNLSDEHATTRMGARFHLRKLFLRESADEFSHSELDFIVQYLVNETTIAEQPWWVALTQYERMEVVNSLELFHVPREENHPVWFSSKDTAKDCVLLYGNAEAKPTDRTAAPVLLFAEGSVVGNMRISSSASIAAGRAAESGSDQPLATPSSLPNVTVSANASTETWRRVKREQAFRNGIQHYNKLTIMGPADYFVLTASHILETTSKAADRLEREQLLRSFGLERFLGTVRKKTFESGALLATEDEQLQTLYFIIEGECRASVKADDLTLDANENDSEEDPFAEKKLAAASAAKTLLVHVNQNSTQPPKKTTQLPIASLGPRSLVGDVSVLLRLKEPATIEAVTAVTVLTLAYDDFIKEMGDLRDPVVAAPIENMKKVAVDTMSFVLERVQAEATYYNCDQTKKIRALERAIADKKPSNPRHPVAALRQQCSQPDKDPRDARAARYPCLAVPSGAPISTAPSNTLASSHGLIPTVVQKYVETVASKSPRNNEAGATLGPVIISKRAHKLTHGVQLYDSDTRMTREMRKAALALNGLHSPLGSKSLGHVLRRRSRTQDNTEEDGIDYREDDDPRIATASSNSRGGADPQLERRRKDDDVQLFLVPTMTRQRQLHARFLTCDEMPLHCILHLDVMQGPFWSSPPTSKSPEKNSLTKEGISSSVAMDSSSVDEAAAAAVVDVGAIAVAVEETEKVTLVATIVEAVETTQVTTTTEHDEQAVTTTTTTTTTTETTVVEDAAEVLAEAPHATAAAAKATAAPKKYYGLGSYLPKVPTIFGDSKKQPHDTKDSDHVDENGSVHAEPPAVDQQHSLTEQSKETTPATAAAAQVPLSARFRGLTMEQNGFTSSLVRKISGFRTQQSLSSTGESPRNSIDGAPPQQQGQRRSLIGASGAGGSLIGGITTTNGNLPSPRSDPSLKARRGACVATKFGTGVVLDFRAEDGFYIVQLVPKSIAYLQEEFIIREIKSVVGERVKTRWGLATVEQYYVDEDMYSIALDWRWDDDHVWRMKATTKKFEKIPKGNSLVQNTKNKIFEGYSAVRESASFGYANVAAKINTTASTYKARTPASTQHHQSQQHDHNHHHQSSSVHQNLGKALTPYGVCTVVQVRSDQFFVVKTKCGATAYLNADSVKMLHRRTNFAIGEGVKTPYGAGEVVAYRDEDEMYEVKLDIAVAHGSRPPMLYISDAHAETMLVSTHASNANYARLSSIFTMTRNSVYSASATVKASASGGLNTLSSVKSKVSTMAAIKMTKVKFQKGERVITSFGSGFVSEVRPLERIYEVQLRRLKFHGFFHESALQAFPYERVTHFIVDGKTIPAPELPKNAPEHKRRHIMTTAIRQAREGR